METDSEKQTLVVEKECEQSVAGFRTVYRLSLLDFAGAQYYAEICRRGERAAAYLGEDGVRAHALFEQLVRGTVTPCTLCDIVRDATLTES